MKERNEMKKLIGKLAFKMVGGFNGIDEMIGGVGEIIRAIG